MLWHIFDRISGDTLHYVTNGEAFATLRDYRLLGPYYVRNVNGTIKRCPIDADMRRVINPFEERALKLA